MKTGKIIVTIIVTNNAGTTLTEGFELLILFLKQLLPYPNLQENTLLKTLVIKVD